MGDFSMRRGFPLPLTPATLEIACEAGQPGSPTSSQTRQTEVWNILCQAQQLLQYAVGIPSGANSENWARIGFHWNHCAMGDFRLIFPFATHMTPTSSVTIYCCRLKGLNPSYSVVFTSWRGLMACCSVFFFHRIRVIKQPEHFPLLTFLISQALLPAALHKGMPKHC